MPPASSPVESRDAQFFDQASMRFAQAVHVSGGPSIRHYRVGGRSVELRFAGSGLEHLLTPAFEHLAADSGDPSSLVLKAWDTASTGVDPPIPTWTEGDYIARGDIRHQLGDRIKMSFSIDAGTLNLFDPMTNTAICWVRDPSIIPPWELAAPFRPILGWWASNTDGQFAHGAAVGHDGVGVLLAANGGGGKSTTALACLVAGLSYLGDDYVLLRTHIEPMVYSLYNTAKLEPQHMRRRLPQLEKLICHQGSPLQDKLTLSLKESYPDQLVEALPLRAILVTSVATSGTTLLAPASGMEVLRALAPTTMFQLPGSGAREFEHLAQVARKVAGYRLELGLDFCENVAAIRRVAQMGATA